MTSQCPHSGHLSGTFGRRKRTHLATPGTLAGCSPHKENINLMFVPLTAQLPDSSNILTAILLHLLILRPLPLVRNGATFFPRRLFKLSIFISFSIQGMESRDVSESTISLRVRRPGTRRTLAPIFSPLDLWAKGGNYLSPDT